MKRLQWNGRCQVDVYLHFTRVDGSLIHEVHRRSGATGWSQIFAGARGRAQSRTGATGPAQIRRETMGISQTRAGITGFSHIRGGATGGSHNLTGATGSAYMEAGATTVVQCTGPDGWHTKEKPAAGITRTNARITTTFFIDTPVQNLQ
jgi:hypothetical protein